MGAEARGCWWRQRKLRGCRARRGRRKMFEKARDEQNAWGTGHRYWTMVFEPLGKRTWTLGIQEGQSPREVSPGEGKAM